MTRKKEKVTVSFTCVICGSVVEVEQEHEGVKCGGCIYTKTPKRCPRLKDTCVECGKSVRLGSGRFVNRVPVLDDYKTRVANGHPYPYGEYICVVCDNKNSDMWGD